MNKKNIAIIIFLLILTITGLYLSKNTITWIYYSPTINTTGFYEVSPIIKELNKAFDYAKFSAESEHNNFSYLYYNAYGSGFLNNNPIPNDLDFAVGINLGEYDYEENNKKEIITSLVEKIDNFQMSFNYYLNTQNNKKIYPSMQYIKLLNRLTSSKDLVFNSLNNNFNNAMSGKEYIAYSTKKIPDGETQKDVDVTIPYIMHKNEILLENFEPITLFSDQLTYSKNMKNYMREITIIPEFYFTLKQGGKSKTITVVPEAFNGSKLQLYRRFFASTVFERNISKKFVDNLSYLKNDEDYFSYRMLSYSRHLQEISNGQVLKDRPIKMLKRIMQTADIIKPYLDENDYAQISKDINLNLSSKEIGLLNEYSNICNTYILILSYPSLYQDLLEEGKIKNMYDMGSNVLQELSKSKKIDKTKLNQIISFNKNELVKILNPTSNYDIAYLKNIVLNSEYNKINTEINNLVSESLINETNLNNYIHKFNQIYTEAGYHKVNLYWLNNNTIGILKDDFTKNIDEIDKFIKENNLIKVNYKLINKSQIPIASVKYGIWGRYNSSLQEEKTYDNLKKALLNDKKKFYAKQKHVINFN